MLRPDRILIFMVDYYLVNGQIFLGFVTHWSSFEMFLTCTQMLITASSGGRDPGLVNLNNHGTLNELHRNHNSRSSTVRHHNTFHAAQWAAYDLNFLAGMKKRVRSAINTGLHQNF